MSHPYPMNHQHPVRHPGDEIPTFNNLMIRRRSTGRYPPMICQCSMNHHSLIIYQFSMKRLFPVICLHLTRSRPRLINPPFLWITRLGSCATCTWRSRWKVASGHLRSLNVSKPLLNFSSPGLYLLYFGLGATFARARVAIQYAESLHDPAPTKSGTVPP